MRFSSINKRSKKVWRKRKRSFTNWHSQDEVRCPTITLKATLMLWLGFKSNREDFECKSFSIFNRLVYSYEFQSALLVYSYMLETSGNAKPRLTFRESGLNHWPGNDLMNWLVASMHDLRAEFQFDGEQTRSRRNSEPTLVCIKPFSCPLLVCY